MDGKTAVWRTGGLAVGLVAALVVIGGGGISRLSARPPVRRSLDIHSEYVKYKSGADSVTAYLAFPERPDPAPAVIVIHENVGLTDFVRTITEQLAKDGFVAIAPDLLSRRGGTAAAGDSARFWIRGLVPDQVTADLDGAAGYVKALRAVKADRIGVIGFCWGGAQSFRFATNNPSLRAFVVCYGSAPETADMARIRARGLGVYGENDARINAGVPAAADAMKQAGKTYAYAVYPGVGHGFLRSRDNPAVADSAWRTVVRFFRAELEAR